MNMTYLAFLVNVARLKIQISHWCQVPDESNENCFPVLTENYTMLIGHGLCETQEVCAVQENEEMEKINVDSDGLAIRVERFSGACAAGRSCSTPRRWSTRLLGQNLLLAFLLCLWCDAIGSNENIKEFHGKMPVTTEGEEMDPDDGADEMQQTYNFQLKKKMNEELTGNENQMTNLMKMKKDGHICVTNTKGAMYDSDSTFRIENKGYQKSMHAGASAATLPVFEDDESHTVKNYLNNVFVESWNTSSIELSIAEFLQKSGVGGVFKILNLKMVGCQKAHSNKPKRKKTELENRTLQPFQLQQREAQAYVIEDAVFTDENGLELTEGMHKNPEDSRYEKTIYVKTWAGRTITAEISLGNVTESLKRKIEEKTGIPVESQKLVAGGKVLKDNTLLKDYGLLGGETIEMTGKLLGGMKKKSLSPKPMDTEREKKRKESEPCIEVGDSLEEENAQTHQDIDPSSNAKWIEDTMKRLQDRTDKKLDTLINCFKEGMEVREKKMEARLENMAKSLSERMNEKFSEFDKRITSVECRGAGGEGHVGPGSLLGEWSPTPMCLKAVIHGFKREAKENELKSLVNKIISDTGMKEEHFIDFPAIPITHAFIEFKERRIRDRFVRSANMREYVLEGGVIRISQALTAEERFDKKRLGYVKFVINKNTNTELHNIHMDLEKKSITIYGQLAVKIEKSGYLQYYTHGEVEEEVTNLMDKWLTKN